MSTNTTDTGLSNPFSTGSGGSSFEQLVGASYLVSLLASYMPRGLDWGITQSVMFQHRWSGCLLDDIVIVSSYGGSSRKLALQIKHKLSFTQSDSTFARVIEDCWQTFTSSLGWEFDPNIDRLGIGLGVYQTKIDQHFRPLLELARTSKDGAEFLHKANLLRFSSKEKRGYIELIENLLVKAKGSDTTADELWRFLKCFVVIHFDLENAGSRDSIYNWNCLLDQIKDRDTGQAKSFFDTLVAIVAKYNRSAGYIDIDQLRAELPANIFLKDSVDFSSDLRRLRQHSQLVLSEIPDSIGLKVHLPRTEIVNQIEISLKENAIVVLSGEPMVGKSVLLKLLANRLQLEGEVISFSIDRFSTSASLEEFLHNINIVSNLYDILSAIGTAPMRCILIDGLEKAVDDNKKWVINDLIRAVRGYNTSLIDRGGHQDYQWRIVLTCRIQEVTNVLTHLETRPNLAEKSLKMVEVNTLTDEELEVVVGQFPKLRELAAQGHLREIITRPLILDILTLPEISLPSVPSVYTETWLLDWFWQEVVRLADQVRQGRGRPDTREQLLINIAKEQLNRNPPIPLSEVKTDNEALSGLVSDRLLFRQNSQIQFAHDAIEDWALTFLLIQNQVDLPGFLIQTNQSLRIVKAFQLYCLTLLEVKQIPDVWVKLLDTLENTDILSPRWYQTALIAPLYSPLLKDIIPQIKPYLLASDGVLLNKLLWALRTFVKQPGQLADLLNGLPQAELEKYIAYLSVPILKQWVPLIQFVLQNLGKIEDRSLFEFSFVAEKWMINTNGNQLFRREIAIFAIESLNARFLEMGFKPVEKSSLSYKEEEQVRKNMVKCVLSAGDCLPEEVDDFIRKKALRNNDNENYGFEELIIEEWGWTSLCLHLPNTAVDIIAAILCEPLEPDDFGSYYHVFFDLGIRSLGDTGPPTPDKGPFHIFLKRHQKQGLELIHRITNHATKAWKLREMTEWNKKPVPQIIKFQSGEFEIWGDDRVFQWYRYPNVAPATVTCALMALEEWMNKEVENEVDPKTLFEQILQKTNSAAVVGVCVSVALANSQRCREAIVPILENPAFWSMDIYRLTQDSKAKTFTEASMIYMSLERGKRHYEKLIELAKQQHRSLDIRSFVLQLLFYESLENWERVQASMRSFPKNPPIFFEHERNDNTLINNRIEICKNWAALAEKENYETFQVDEEGTIGIQFKLPPELEEQQKEKNEFLERQNKLYSFQSWVIGFLKDNKIGKAFSLISAMEYVQELIELDDPTYQPQDFMEISEQHANVIAMFVAGLVVNSWEWVENNSYVTWCRTQLLIAATRPEPPPEYGLAQSRFEMGYRRSAARALPILLLKHPQDTEIRKAILKLSRHENNEVRNYLFLSLRKLWDINEKLVWESIQLAEQHARKQAIRRKYQYLDQDYDVVTWTKSKKLKAKLNRQKEFLSARFYPKPIRDCLYNEIAPDVFRSIFCALPIDVEILGWVSENRLNFLTDLLSFTVNNYIHFEPKSDKSYNKWHPNDWNCLCFKILANAVLRLPPGFVQKLVDPIINRWQEAPSMLEQFLRELSLTGSEVELENRLLEIWLPIGDIVLASEYCQSPRWLLRREIENILGLLICSDPTRIITWHVDTWKPLWQMTEFIRRWVDTVGHHPNCFPNLVRLLKTIGFELVPEHGLHWLHLCLQKVENRNIFFERSHSASLLAELLHDSWMKQHSLIERNSVNLEKFTFLVDILVEQGESVAISVQKKLQA